jgi:hypothetical protein
MPQGTHVRLTLGVVAGARRRSAFDEGANVAILEPALAEERREGKKEREEREGQGGVGRGSCRHGWLSKKVLVAPG